MWRRIFDPATSIAEKEALILAFRRDVDSPFPSHFSVSGLGVDIEKAVRSYGELPERFTLGIVMVGGYSSGRHAKAFASMAGRTPEVALIGPTVRMFHSELKKFADGTLMAKGQLYIPREHLETLCDNRGNLMVVIDLHPDTGATLARTVHTLRQIGYEGEMLIDASFKEGRMTLSEHDRHYGNPHKVTSEAEPLQIVTEYERLADGFQLQDRTEMRA